MGYRTKELWGGTTVDGILGLPPITSRNIREAEGAIRACEVLLGEYPAVISEAGISGWSESLNVGNSYAVFCVGGAIKSALRDHMSVDFPHVSSDPIERGFHDIYLKAKLLEIAFDKVNSVTEGNFSELRDSASNGEVETVRAVLGGLEQGHVTDAINAILQLSRVFPKDTESRMKLTNEERADLLGSVGMYLGRLIADDVVEEMPRILDEGLRACREVFEAQ